MSCGDAPYRGAPLHARVHQRPFEQRIVGSLGVTAVRRVVSHPRSRQTGGSDRTATSERGPCCGWTRECLRQPGPAAKERDRDMSDHATNAATEAFLAYRNLLFTVAYEML